MIQINLSWRLKLILKGGQDQMQTFIILKKYNIKNILTIYAVLFYEPLNIERLFSYGANDYLERSWRWCTPNLPQYVEEGWWCTLSYLYYLHIDHLPLEK